MAGTVKGMRRRQLFEGGPGVGERAGEVDPARCDRTVMQCLIGYVAVWTLYGVLAKGSQDVHFDMGEAVAWSREPAWGYSKHPPLSAWVVKAWFAIFPAAMVFELAGVALLAFAARRPIA